MTNQSIFSKYPKSLDPGFTLIEILVVFSITIFVTISILTSVFRAKPSLTEASQILISDIRMVQANALASKQFQDPATGIWSYRCGYGLSHFSNTDSSYFLYAGNVNSTGSCLGTKTYSSGSNTPIFFTRNIDSKLELEVSGGSQFRDVYFESPDGMVFVNNSSCPVNGTLGKSQVVIKKRGATCPSADCVYLCVYAFGKIESRTTACPSIAC